MKETILDIQTCMHDNLIFSSIPEHPSDNLETLLKDFMKTQLELPPNTVNHIIFRCVHLLGSCTNKSPQPVTKLEHFEHKELVKSKGKELSTARNTDSVINSRVK